MLHDIYGSTCNDILENNKLLVSSKTKGQTNQNLHLDLRDTDSPEKENSQLRHNDENNISEGFEDDSNLSQMLAKEYFEIEQKLKSL